jgi:carbon-monoxide dehydrogenase iron sulfur subunit
MKTVFVNPERCIGCRQCEFACAVAKSQTGDPIGALFEIPPPHRRIHVEAGPTPNTSFPNKCRHCDPAPCQQVCPTGAIYRDPDEGLVLLDTDKCIACAMCAIVCPFSAITFHPIAGNGNGTARPLAALKCDGCIDRVQQGEEPACVEVCKTDALVYGELNDLVAQERAGAAAQALVAVSAIDTDSARESDNVTAWRGFGKQLAEIGSRES